MVEIERDHDAAENSTGKSLHHIARYERPGPGPVPPRKVIDIVTDDFRLYRFSQMTNTDPWTFEPGDGRGHRVQRTGRLPAVVNSIIESEAEDVAGEWGNGVNY